MISLDLLHIYQRLEDIGLVRSRREFGRVWCDRSEGLVRDYKRRGATVVRAKTVATLRMRLREAAEALPAATAVLVREIEADVAQAASWTGQIQRRAAMAEDA